MFVNGLIVDDKWFIQNYPSCKVFFLQSQQQNIERMDDL